MAEIDGNLPPRGVGPGQPVAPAPVAPAPVAPRPGAPVFVAPVVAPPVALDPPPLPGPAVPVQAPPPPVIPAVGPPLTADELESLGQSARTRKSELFAKEAPLSFGLASDFTQISAQKQALALNDTPVAAKLSVGGQESDVELKVRGESSIHDLPLPKLKLKVADGAGASPFKAKQKLELGVHGNTIGNPSPVAFSSMKRELDDHAPRREALAYAVLEELGLPSPATRVGEIDYTDTQGDADVANDVAEGGRSALLVESVGDMAKRWGGKEIQTTDFGLGQSFNVRKEDNALAMAGELLIGNSDFGFRTRQSPDGQLTVTGAPHNAKIIQLSDGWVRIAPTDFDLCAWTLTHGTPAANSWGGARKDFKAELARIVSGLPLEQQRPFLEKLISRRDAVAQRVSDYPLLPDDSQKAFLLERVGQFFDAAQVQLAALA